MLSKMAVIETIVRTATGMLTKERKSNYALIFVDEVDKFYRSTHSAPAWTDKYEWFIE